MLQQGATPGRRRCCRWHGGNGGDRISCPTCPVVGHGGDGGRAGCGFARTGDDRRRHAQPAPQHDRAPVRFPADRRMRARPAAPRDQCAATTVAAADHREDAAGVDGAGRAPGPRGQPRGADRMGLAGHAAHRRRADPGHRPVAQGLLRRPRRAALPGNDRQGRLSPAGRDRMAGNRRSAGTTRALAGSRADPVHPGSRDGAGGRIRSGCRSAGRHRRNGFDANATRPALAGYRRGGAGRRWRRGLAAAVAAGRAATCRRRSGCASPGSDRAARRRRTAGLPAHHLTAGRRILAQRFARWRAGRLHRLRQGWRKRRCRADGAGHRAGAAARTHAAGEGSRRRHGGVVARWSPDRVHPLRRQRPLFAVVDAFIGRRHPHHRQVLRRADALVQLAPGCPPPDRQRRRRDARRGGTLPRAGPGDGHLDAVAIREERHRCRHVAGVFAGRSLDRLPAQHLAVRPVADARGRRQAGAADAAADQHLWPGMDAGFAVDRVCRLPRRRRRVAAAGHRQRPRHRPRHVQARGRLPEHLQRGPVDGFHADQVARGHLLPADGRRGSENAAGAGTGIPLQRQGPAAGDLAGWPADRVRLRPLGTARRVVGGTGTCRVAAPDRRHHPGGALCAGVVGRQPAVADGGSKSRRQQRNRHL